MLDERKVKLMTRLALYEETEGKEDFKISAIYRKGLCQPSHAVRLYLGDHRLHLCGGHGSAGRS